MLDLTNQTNHHTMSEHLGATIETAHLSRPEIKDSGLKVLAFTHKNNLKLAHVGDGVLGGWRRIPFT